MAGTWKDLTDSVNKMAEQPDGPGAKHRAGDHGRCTGRSVQENYGRSQRRNPGSRNTINTMVDLLNAFAAEVTRVAREVGTEGKLGGQADVRGVAGTWKDLTDSVNKWPII